MGLPRRAQRRLLLCLALLLVAREALGSVEEVITTKPSQRAPWEEAVWKAAETAVKAIAKRTGSDLSLTDVQLETLQVFTGRQHHLGLSLDGVQYDLVLGGQPADVPVEEPAAARSPSPHRPALALPPATAGMAKARRAKAVQDVIKSSTALQPMSATDVAHWKQQGEGQGVHPLALPDVTFTGPLELHVPSTAAVSLFLPHAVDGMGSVRRLKLKPGVTVRVSGLKALTLRQPVDLPPLPVGYLVESWAHMRTGEAEPGFERAPGIHYLANALQQIAMNSSIPVLSFDLEPASGEHGIRVASAHTHPTGQPSSVGPKLKAKRLRDKSVELSVRQGEVQPARTKVDLAALYHTWAWPLPHVDMSAFVPYETLLRSILASHPFDLDKVQKQGISMKLTKSEMRSVRMMGFEIQVRSSRGALPKAEGEGAKKDSIEGAPAAAAPEEQQPQGIEMGGDELLVFEVSVEVIESEKGFVYKPGQVTLKARHGSTLTISKDGMLGLLAGEQNSTVVLPLPVGYEEEDVGLARYG